MTVAVISKERRVWVELWRGGRWSRILVCLCVSSNSGISSRGRSCHHFPYRRSSCVFPGRSQRRPAPHTADMARANAKRQANPGGKRAKHGGSNGKKEGLSGSSFFTWFMVIALLGVWTSVAVVWFDLVDYEDVLGKLDAYDSDGDGDFDIEDAKILLGLSSLPVEKAAKAPDVSRGSLKTKSKEEVKEGIKEQLKRVKEKYLAPLKEKSHRDGEKPKKDSGRGDKDEEKSEHRRKKDDKEITKRTTSGRTSNADRDKKTEKKADKQ